MVKMYDRENWRDDLNEFVEVRELEGLLAVFHVVQGFNQERVYNPPTDPEVGLTKEDLEDRIRKRDADHRNVDEEKKAMQAIEDYRRARRRRHPG